ncbi:MAG TPA: outer membrane lipid asymmetry maintenance protein MlaD [Desulfuromonadales bacterium]|nr:outer membrane lipid asymmetry maintenance protein MlaD [Desulfuromonadales bacterium]
MKKFNLEIVVGLFMVAGFVCFAWLSIKLGDIDLLGSDSYQVTARFGSISGLKQGAVVEIAGVKVGSVEQIRLNRETYEAVVSMSIKRDVDLQEDSIASIRTAGIIGDRYVAISPGGSPELIEDGGTIFETESAINLEELVSKYIFESE